MYDIIILKEGYMRPEPHGSIRACGTITLLKSPTNNIIVDTGNPWDKDTILKALADNGLKPENLNYVICSNCQMGNTGNLNLFTRAVHLMGSDICKGLANVGLVPDDIKYVVGTHGHSDHVGNLNLFSQALHVIGFDICRQDLYILHDFKKGIPYEIDEDVEIWPTPGHTGNDVSVIVKNTNLGTVAITGDLFECEADLDCPSLWQEVSENPYLQQKCRLNILKAADYIVPGHGAMFEVPKDYKQQMRVVMLTEEYYSSSGSETTKTDCIIVETD